MTLHTDVAIIGAGTAGLGAFRAATANGAHALLIEAGPGGTTCAREGCMPSKLLLAAAHAAHHARTAAAFGVQVPAVAVDGPAVLRRVRAERDRFVGFVLDGHQAIPAEQRLQARARFAGPTRLELDDGRHVQARSVVVATGSRPIILPMLRGLGDRLLTNREVFEWPDLPDSVVVFGPGAIGLELAQALHRLGVRVRLLGIGGLLGPLTDLTVRAVATRVLAEELALETDARVERVWREGDRVVVERSVDGRPRTEDFAFALCAVGRAPNLDGLDLASTGLPLDERGRPPIDPRTAQAADLPIFFAGDANPDRPLLHEAADEGRIAGTNAARHPQVERFDRRSPLGIVFSDPQLAVVGEGWASLQGEDIVVGSVDFSDQGRSRVQGENRGWLNLYADRSTGRLRGAELAHPRAEHLAHLLAWSHQAGLSVERMLAMPFYHPVVEEGLRTALRDAESRIRASRLARSA